MYYIKVTGEFSAAHHISGYDGDCANLHGHNWKVRAVLKSPDLDALGMACDFRKAKAVLYSVLDELDHSDLNAHKWFAGKNPTSERIAEVVFAKMEIALANSIELDSIEVFESDKSSVEYRK